MTDYRNSSEYETQTTRQRLECKRALWAGRHAYLAGVSPDDNPHNGWNKREDGIHTHQCLLWCRWLHGWLIEFYAKQGVPTHGA